MKTHGKWRKLRNIRLFKQLRAHIRKHTYNKDWGVEQEAHLSHHHMPIKPLKPFKKG